jgi:hypothetical protein
MNNFKIHADNLLGRDRYLDRLNARVEHFATTQSLPSRRVIDDARMSRPVDFEVPEVEADVLTVDIVKEAISDKGCLIVRNFLNELEAQQMQSYVDYSFKLHNKPENKVSQYLLKQVELAKAVEHAKDDIAKQRETNKTYTDITKIARKLGRTLGQSSSQLTATTPIITDKILALYDRKGLKDLLNDYFENEPCVSIYKWVLRKAMSPPVPIDFHQDGAFMGPGIDSLNVWVALSDCGGDSDAPGMDFLPVRLKSDFEKGTGSMNWTVAESAVHDVYGQQAVVAPRFNRGDALFFDHFLVHRTQHVADCARNRYAVETWFFDSVNFPKNQIPVKW